MVQNVLRPADFDWILDNYAGRELIRIPITKTTSNYTGEETLTEGTPEEIKAYIMRTNQNWNYKEYGFIEKGDAVALIKFEDEIEINDLIYSDYTDLTISNIDGDATTITVNTVEDHGLTDGQQVVIGNTTNYNGVYTKQAAISGWSDTAKAGLVAYYTMDESSGDMLDSVNSNDGTLNGLTTQGAVGILSTCYNFPGSNNNVQVNSITTDNTWAFAFWFNITDSANVGAVFDSYTSGSNRSNCLFAGGDIRVGIQSNYYLSKTPAEAADGNWHHIAISQDAGTLKVWYDGVIDIDTTCTPTTLGGSTAIGSGWSGATNLAFKGRLDEIPIWDNGITQEIVDEIYNSGAAKNYAGSVEVPKQFTIASTSHDFDAETSGYVLKDWTEFRIRERFDVPGIFDSTGAGTEMVYTACNLFLSK